MKYVLELWDVTRGGRFALGVHTLLTPWDASWSGPTVDALCASQARRWNAWIVAWTVTLRGDGDGDRVVASGEFRR
jgi:hypothetical protein